LPWRPRSVAGATPFATAAEVEEVSDLVCAVIIATLNRRAPWYTTRASAIAAGTQPALLQRLWLYQSAAPAAITWLALLGAPCLRLRMGT
jgi:hypothetical protein